jgi:ubiquinone/menaquinone biosynthesis C-methylase UbiE
MIGFTNLYYRLYNFLSPSGGATPSSGLIQGKVREQFIALSPHQGKLLEVGCGEALFLGELAGKYPQMQLLGVDINVPRLELAKSIVARQSGAKVNFSCQNAVALTFEDNYFDTVVCMNLLYILDSLEMVRTTLVEMLRVCKSQGTLVFDLRMNRNPLYNLKNALGRHYDKTIDHPLYCYSSKQVEQLVQSLQVEILYRGYLPGIIGILAPIQIYKIRKP